MKGPLLLSLVALLVAGCSSLEKAPARPDLSGRYAKSSDSDLPNFDKLYGTKEFEFFPDGTAVKRVILGKIMRDIVLERSPESVVTERRGGKKVYMIKNAGTWRIKGDKIIYQDDGMAVAPPLVDFFRETFNLKAPRARLSSRHIFTVDANGDLMRIPPRGHAYYAGRFVKQK